MKSRVDDLLLSNRDDEALVIETLVDEFYNYIYRLSYSILHDHDTAEDAVQETLIIAYLKLDHYQSGTNLRAWLSTIAVNHCRNQIRKQKRRMTKQDMWHSFQGVFGKQDSPEASAMQGETDSQLWAAIDKMDDKHRLPLILRYVHGLPVREIADILEVKPGTIHSRLHYGVKKLRTSLKRSDCSLQDIREVLP